ncbi:MAG: hypothetical protein ACOYK9_03550 [Chlamydiia bacterium]
MSHIMTKHKEDFVLLLEAGFVAIMHQDEDTAVKLFRSAQLLDRENVMPRIGIAYMHLLKLELKSAIMCLKEVLHKEPHNEFAKALYGVCLTFSPDMSAEGAKMLHETEKHSKDPAIQKLTKDATHFYEKFIKGPPSPEEVTSHKRT